MRKPKTPQRVTFDPSAIKGSIPTGVASVVGERITKYADALRVLPLGEERPLQGVQHIPAVEPNTRSTRRKQKAPSTLW